MKIRILEQIHVSSISSDTLRPGQEFEVSDALAKELLRHHADKVALVKEAKVKAAKEPANKAAPKASNK